MLYDWWQDLVHGNIGLSAITVYAIVLLVSVYYDNFIIFGCTFKFSYLFSELQSNPFKNKQYLIVVTGKGSHSRGGVSKLKPAVTNYLRRNDYR